MRSLHHSPTPTFPKRHPLTENYHFNGQIPTGPHTVLLATLAIICAAGQLTPEQAAALASTGGIAELALVLLHLTQGRRQ